MSRVFLFGLIKSYKNIITLTFRNGNQVAIIQTIANNGHKKFLNTKAEEFLTCPGKEKWKKFSIVNQWLTVKKS
jgi:hypothetical protein